MFSRSPDPSRFPGYRAASQGTAKRRSPCSMTIWCSTTRGRSGALRDTPADESWRESADGTALTVLHYRSESGDETIEKLVWLREDNMQPVYAELFADGTRELSIRFTSYQENGG